MKRITWKELVKIEPELLELAKEAQAYKEESKGKDYVCANDRWYGYGKWRDKSIRLRLIQLVGWTRKDDARLYTSEAYDVAYQHVYNLLPDCKNCWCIGLPVDAAQ
jgi:hypothetical protein